MGAFHPMAGEAVRTLKVRGISIDIFLSNRVSRDYHGKVMKESGSQKEKSARIPCPRKDCALKCHENNQYNVSPWLRALLKRFRDGSESESTRQEQKR